jgi:hypothetical protein
VESAFAKVPISERADIQKHLTSSVLQEDLTALAEHYTNTVTFVKKGKFY